MLKRNFVGKDLGSNKFPVTSQPALGGEVQAALPFWFEGIWLLHDAVKTTGFL